MCGRKACEHQRDENDAPLRDGMRHSQIIARFVCPAAAAVLDSSPIKGGIVAMRLLSVLFAFVLTGTSAIAQQSQPIQASMEKTAAAAGAAQQRAESGRG